MCVGKVRSGIVVIDTVFCIGNVLGVVATLALKAGSSSVCVWSCNVSADVLGSGCDKCGVL